MPNALAQEKSPYLLQHADNPVAWLPWGEAAFAKARAEQKPIFLSIGYSTCHWCHVMAHESFENPATAAILNEHFVPIKVDREERPDVDRVYMTYVQAMTGHGGWPLSAWLTPDLKPFYGGTYFPPEDRHGRAGFPVILKAIADGWRDEREKLVNEAERAIATLRAPREPAGNAAAPTAPLADAAGEAFDKCFRYFYESFDAQNGGFGGAPKFPRASNLNFLFRCAALQGGQSELGAEALRMATFTLQQMAKGGLHDHVGGGFHRYSVDGEWFVPHFEKMLYDQAQIALNTLEAKQATGDERFAWLARGIFEYVADELTHPAGGFYSAEDADSQVPGAKIEAGGAHSKHATQAEGAFYVWTQAELAEALGDDAPFVGAHFGVAVQGNVPPTSDPHQEFTGKNILAQRRSLLATAQAHRLDPEAASGRLLAALGKLREVRAKRPRPHLDDKIITAWNGLMISALARGAVVLGDAALKATATKAAEFLQRELFDAKSGLLYRSYRDGRSEVKGFSEDYAFLIQGLLDLYEASFERRWLEWAEQLQRTMDGLFWDEAKGGYFNSAADDPAIVLRLKEDYDGAEPAPSSVAALNLLRLAAILDGVVRPGADIAITSYRVRGQRTIEAFRAQWSGVPHAMPQMLCALELALDAPRHVVLAGDPATKEFQALVTVFFEKLRPFRGLAAVTNDADRAWWQPRAPWLAEMKPLNGIATAYVCEEFACQAPVTSPEDLRRLLN
jgi:uncharacterized protein YyaL (SSP411 family)